MWTTHAAGEPPDPEQIARWRRRTSPPGNEMPVATGVSELLVRTADVAVGLVGLRAFSNGVQFDVAVRVREFPTGAQAMDLHRAILGRAAPGPDEVDRRLLLGVQFADGRTVSTIDGAPRPGGDLDADRPLLFPSGGGGGSSGSLTVSFWLTPVPPDGPLTFVVAWPVYAVAETRWTLAEAMTTRDSAATLELWPAPALPESGGQPPRPPDLPDDSWFRQRRPQ